MPDNHEALVRQLKRLNDNLETLVQRLTVAPFPPPPQGVNRKLSFVYHID